MYEIKHGKHEALIIRDCVATGRELPEFIANAPELPAHLSLFYDAFHSLHSCRDMGMSVGMIPWDKIQMFADYHELDEEQAWDMHFFLSRMDAAYLKWQKENLGKH